MSAIQGVSERVKGAKGDQGCFVNLLYLLVRYIVVPVIDSICLCVYGCGCVCARVCVCV